MKKQKGFTLIELMIVVVIIGILASILFGRAGRISPTDDGTTCVGGMKHSRSTGQQVFGANGGGIPCDSVAVVQ